MLKSFEKRIFCLRELSIGWLLVAKSHRGICHIALGDTAQQLLQEFTGHFSDIQQDADDNVFHQEVVHIVAMVETPHLVRHYDLPLDIRGTAFQQRVWAALCEVQCGETISYTELAQHIGMPKAVRAVANACARNELALAIPCHRVLCKNGAVSGYRWGIQRKQIVLQREQRKCF
ncbi:methylated-DNA--[protein]-cysteine S-methyltransferase [Bartonella sp. A05]|uniref:methylated-DNA--[protein]-cysteine S-methyltransferase n=1 Tax=Bartonella sp. A05 TaxID=2967261 RepID=UPI0022A94FF6|nr:methylated-DNA--[protein]-cysteine S-methyltransferase [Bartonella sp. A05]MCZ2203841.1 methylated-DNA--[protein]-cysteine S-methyltransferase [Bartonella sp. A05]